MPRFVTEDHKTFSINDEGERRLLANFAARITEQVHSTDGIKVETTLTLEGEQPGPEEGSEPVKLPAVTVKAAEFPSMSWVLREWGVRAVVMPEARAKDDMRVAIQLASQPRIKTVYQHTGWTEIGGDRVFLHATGGIGPDGKDRDVSVDLPRELERYSIQSEATERDGIAAMLALLKVGPLSITWSLLAAALAPVIGTVDFATHLVGKTGTYKSEVVSLFQSLYGAEMDARALPGSWSSTANALEALAYRAKDCAFVVDDFVPQGSSWQIRAYQQTAERVIRAQGNQAGRTRLTDTSSLQETYYPRGAILSTGEDTPEGHSVRARMMILDLAPGDIVLKALTASQHARAALPAATRSFIAWVARTSPDWKPRAEEARDRYINVGHSRTPAMIGRLIATVDQVVAWLRDRKVAREERLTELHSAALDAILVAAQGQKSHLESADPCDVFMATIRQIFGAGLGHARTRSGGVPGKPELLGWTVETSQTGAKDYRSHGPTIGWYDSKTGELLIDITAGLAIIKKVAGPEMPLSKQTMVKRLRDSGCLTRIDETRERNTVRVTAEGHSRQVIAISAALALDEADTSEVKE